MLDRRCVLHHVSSLIRLKATWFQERWGAITKFIHKINPLLPVLKQFWNVATFEAGSRLRDADAADSRTKFNPKNLADTLKDPLFSCYTAMVLGIFTVLEDLAGWFEGCSFHEDCIKGIPRHKAKSRLAEEFVADREFSGCPMMGKRGPELAAGCIHNVFEALGANTRTALLEDCTTLGLPSGQQHVVFEDFEKGLSFLQLGLQVKLDFWGRLPWRLIGLAHHSIEVGRGSSLP